MGYNPKGYWNYDRTCRICGEPFKGSLRQKTCRLCKAEKMNRPRLPTGTVGAINELRVSIDLMRKGYEVFRALSPHAPFDLFAIKDGKQFDIEVRAAYRNLETGKIYSSRKNIKGKYKAFVTEQGIIYEPDFF